MKADLAAALQATPHLMSPAALARADTEGKWKMAPHLAILNRELMGVAFTPASRLIVNVPFPTRKIDFSLPLLPRLGATTFP